MQQFCTCGSARGTSGNWRPYRDPWKLRIPMCEAGTIVYLG